MAIKTGSEALATHLGMDMADLSHYSYQPGRFTRSVYSVDDGYWCATKDKNKLPQPTRQSTNRLDWKQVEDKHLATYGWMIFKCTIQHG